MNIDQVLLYFVSYFWSFIYLVVMFAEIRLYGDRNTGDGNTLSLYVAAGKVITSVDIWNNTIF